MEVELKQQEREIDRQLATLAEHLRSPAPRPDVIAAVKAAVDAEARRLRQRDRRLAVLRPLVGAAAAVLLAVGLSLSGGTEPFGQPLALSGDPDAVLAEWVDALGESGDQFTVLLEEDWLFEGIAPSDDDYGDLGDPLDSLEESLESLEQTIGV